VTLSSAGTPVFMRKKKYKPPFLLRAIQWSYPKVERIAPALAHRFFMTLFFTPLKHKTPEKEIKSATFAEKFTVTVTGKKVQVYQWGKSDKTILFVHGWAGRATQFRRFIKSFLAAGYQCVGFDGPAHGLSEGKTTTIREFADAMQKIVDRVGQPEAVIAHSFGGGATLFAITEGLPVKTVVTMASPTIADEIIHTYMITIGASEKTRAAFKKEVIRRYGKPFEEFTALRLIHRLPKPINLFMVSDEDDREVKPEHAHALKAVYPAAQVHLTRGLGHNRILKDSQVISAILEFVKDHPL
jgi:esterase/lipase